MFLCFLGQLPVYPAAPCDDQSAVAAVRRLTVVRGCCREPVVWTERFATRYVRFNRVVRGSQARLVCHHLSPCTPRCVCANGELHEVPSPPVPVAFECLTPRTSGLTFEWWPGMVRSQCGATARLEPGLVPRRRVKVCNGNERRTLMGPAPCPLPMAVSGIPVLPPASSPVSRGAEAHPRTLSARYRFAGSDSVADRDWLSATHGCLIVLAWTLARLRCSASWRAS